MPTLNDLINFQANYIKISKYENEFLTMKALYGHPKEVEDLFRWQILEWFRSLLPKTETVTERTAKSLEYRERGNKLLKVASKENALQACRLYTEAILSAPLGETLALAHANRAVALQEFGYYQEAYDDCECALEEGYPEIMRHKLWTRQAFCAHQMGDARRLRQHLDTLKGKELNRNFAVQIERLREGLIRLEEQENVNGTMDQNSLIPQKTQVLENATKGRYIIATESISEDELILTERASSFVPAGVGVDGRVCAECGATLFIPFPCHRCHGKVVYCSLMCRRTHRTTHAYECVAHQMNLFAQTGIAHLAMRIVLENLPRIVAAQRFRNLPPAAIWTELMRECNCDDSKPELEYFQTLKLLTHLDKKPMDDIFSLAVVSKVLVLYLSEFTDFYRCLSKADGNSCDWQLITGSLILRHSGQLMANAHACISCFPKIRCSTTLNCTLMAENLWASARHVRRGFLHQFGNIEQIAAANFPYLSLCNHACVPSLHAGYSGRCIKVFATTNIPKGEEIFTCYTFDYRTETRSVRRQRLKEFYHFVCNCSKCSAPNADEDYKAFHRYRCDRSQCGQIFTPLLSHQKSLNWWESFDELDANEAIIECSICKARQHCRERHMKFLELIRRLPESRQDLFNYFENYIDKYLLDYHELKLTYAIQIVMECYEAHLDGSHLSDSEFSTLITILEFYLRGIATQNRFNAIGSVIKMTYLWDFIALGKYKPTSSEMKKMLKAIEILSDEMKQLWLNYYEDYIAHNVI